MFRQIVYLLTFIILLLGVGVEGGRNNNIWIDRRHKRNKICSLMSKNLLVAIDLVEAKVA